MKQTKNIAVLAALTIVCAWMVGCAGCNPEPLPTGMSPHKAPKPAERPFKLPAKNLI